MSEKKYILFDHDGVLVDTEHGYYNANKKALAELGFELDLQVYLVDMAAGIACWERLRAAGVDEQTIIGKRRQRDRYYRDFLRSESIAIPGVVPVLEQLSAHYKLAIVTTAKRADFELIHSQRTITRYFDFVIDNEDCSHSKPHPEPYLLALQRFGATPEQALVVEDSARGLRAAVAAGIDCVVVHNDFTEAQDFTGATAKIECLAQLPGLLAHYPQGLDFSSVE